MDSRLRHRYGLRPTLRQMMILVAWAAVVAALARRNLGPLGPCLILGYSPVLLGILILWLDRPGAVKYWLSGLVMSLSSVTIVGGLDYAFFGLGLWSRIPLAARMVVVAFNALAIAWLLVLLWRRWPRRCGACGHRSVLRLGRRPRWTFWCASCGRKAAEGSS